MLAKDLQDRVDEIAGIIRSVWPTRPEAGIVLGTGLGGLADAIEQEAVFEVRELPHLPAATAIGHRGALICGRLGSVPVIAQAGRYHAYEGYPQWQITLPIRVMHQLGIRRLIMSNASGGLNPHYDVGDLVVVQDHMSLLGSNPFCGVRGNGAEADRTDMSCPYDQRLVERALEIARQERIIAHKGVYLAVTGPNFETRVEIRFMRQFADVVGMSTVPEVIVASQLDLPVAAFSMVTNRCLADVALAPDGHRVAEVAAVNEPRLRRIVTRLVGELGDGADPVRPRAIRHSHSG